MELFYVANFGPAEEADFAGFDSKLDVIVRIIAEKYSKTENLPDLWQDPKFKLMYLLSAMSFKALCAPFGLNSVTIKVR